ncbi:nuclear transport factor 2 family protein [Streptomyces sp. NPDC046805]|uniref:nuclear transport factor 2 family protein n=1 Tax=Streptomyces sp. NPDC046805 TaxID=3155134 RepID=UPI0033CF5A2D
MTVEFMASVGTDAITREAVEQLLGEYQSSYETSSPDYFKLFAADATFFVLSSPNRIDSREEFQRVFSLAPGTTRRSQILSPEIRIMGDSALVSLHSRVALGDEQHYLRETLVVTRDGRGALRIAHLHISPQEMPAVPDTPERALEEISVIEERTATTACTVGTPK